MTTSYGQGQVFKSGKQLHTNSRAFNMMDMTFLGAKRKPSKPSVDLFRDDLIVDATARKSDAPSLWVKNEQLSGHKKLLPIVNPAAVKQRPERGFLINERSQVGKKTR